MCVRSRRSRVRGRQRVRGHLKAKHAGHPREGELLALQGEQRALQRGHVTAQAGGQLADGMVGVPAALAERRHAILALEAAVDEVLWVDAQGRLTEGTQSGVRAPAAPPRPRRRAAADAAPRRV